MEEFYIKMEKLVEKANSNPAFQKKVAGWDRSIHFCITDSEESCTVMIRNGEASLKSGGVPKPDITVTTDMETFDEIIKGSLKPSRTFLTGRLKVEGTIPDMIKMNSVFKTVLRGNRQNP